MTKKSALILLFLFMMYGSQAQLGARKLVGPNTSDYALGYGAFIKTGFPLSEAAGLTVEASLNIFPLKGYGLEYGTIMCPLKLGYRYTFNGSGEGFYAEPQAGYNLYGITSLPADYGDNVELKYHGVVLAAGGGYLFSIKNIPIDINLRYETVIANGGSNNFISLGITRFFSLGKKSSDY